MDKIPTGEKIALYLTIIAILLIALFTNLYAAQVPRPVWQPKMRLFSVTDGSPAGEVMDLPHAPFKEPMGCLKFLFAIGPLQADEGLYVVTWCEKSGPDEKTT